jgi:hypothetical protein
MTFHWSMKITSQALFTQKNGVTIFRLMHNCLARYLHLRFIKVDKFLCCNTICVKSPLSESQESAVEFCSRQVDRLDFLTRHLLTGSKAGDYEELRERTYTKILSNGTLLLQHVKEDREGFYLCHASNGIGSGLGKVVQLKVNCE